jgi:hypothetical protein
MGGDMTKIFARVVLLGALTMAFAGGVSRAAIGTAELERAFWLCDYASATGPVDAGTLVTCSAVYEDLSIRKFEGDLEAMLTWYEQNKAVQHHAIAAASH